MYKRASQNLQHAARAIPMADRMVDRARLTLEDNYAALRRVILSIEEELKGPMLTVERRVALGQRKLETQTAIKKLKPLLNIAKRVGIAQYFMDAAKQMLQPAQFKIIYNAAAIDHDRDRAKLAEFQET